MYLQAHELPDGIIPENEDESTSANGDCHNTGHRTSSESRSLLMFFLLWQSLYKVSDKGILLLLKFLKGQRQCTWSIKHSGLKRMILKNMLFVQNASHCTSSKTV